jgi:CubicO group peptidase (beta-lactamase class C family)/predicted glycoside hydrolase/deacetylase ChbG (UPF0249 family)
MKLSKTPIFLFLFFGLIIGQLRAQTTDALPRSTPEAEGISSEGISQFLDAVGKSQHEVHSLMVLRHGKVVAEGWWNPYRADLKHTMYSCSKSFTATAIGFAVSEKRLTVNDKVISFFPDDLPKTISPNLAELKIKDLLSMSAGQDFDPSGMVNSRDSNWIRGFLSIPFVHQPGTKFLYNSLCTYTLSAIVQKVTGEKVIDYLTPRLFKPLGITGADWEVDPRGINVGGWGLRIKTEDMAKFGQLFLQKGMWNGKQVLPKEWVEEASTTKIIQHPDLAQEKKDASDWEQGYCYQMWRCRNNAYRGDGAFGQFIIVMPDQDAVIILTSETGNMQEEFNLVWKYLYPAIKKDDKLPANKSALAALKQQLATLALPLAAKGIASPLVKAISGKTFALAPNDKFIQKMGFQFKDDLCQVTFRNKVDSFKIAFAAGKWAFGETKKIGPALTGAAKAHFVGLPPPKVAGNYQWKNDSTLELVLRYIESPHTETFTCQFSKNAITVDVQNSFDKNAKKSMKGVMASAQLKPIQIIMRGDDMGFSHSGNEALVQAYTKGIETSIEIIVPSPWFPEAVKLLEQNPGIDVGVHLAITSEWDNVKWRPLTDCPSIRDPNGYFYPMVNANKNYPGLAIKENQWKLEDIEKEMRAQIEMAIKKVPRISHFSGHMGCNWISPEVSAMTKKLAKAYNIDIDLGELGVKNFTYAGPKGTGKEKIQSFIAALKNMEPGQTYLFVDHPGIDDAELRAISHIGYENVAEDRQGVTELFTSKELKDFIQQNGIQLVSYKDLMKK